MMTQNADKKRGQIQMFCMDDLVPQDYLLRIIDKAIDWNFIFDLVVDKYSPNNGCPSMDPVMLIKLLIDDGITPILPYKCPVTKDGFFKTHEYVYDEYYDCYICPNNQVLTTGQPTEMGIANTRAAELFALDVYILHPKQEKRFWLSTCQRHFVYRLGGSTKCAALFTR